MSAPSGTGSRASHEAASASSPEASIPSAVQRLRENAEALKAYSKSFDEHARQASDPLFGRGYGIEERVIDLFALTARLFSSIYTGLLDAASAIEARSDATGTGAAEGESAVPQADAPKVSQ